MKIALLILFGLFAAWGAYNSVVLYFWGKKIKQLQLALDRWVDACERDDHASAAFFDAEFDRIKAECAKCERRKFLI